MRFLKIFFRIKWLTKKSLIKNLGLLFLDELAKYIHFLRSLIFSSKLTINRFRRRDLPKKIH